MVERPVFVFEERHGDFGTMAGTDDGLVGFLGEPPGSVQSLDASAAALVDVDERLPAVDDPDAVDVDERGRTGVEGLYAAGRLAEKPHQAIVCAGHGAEVGVTILEDDDRPFYHDWVAPQGYFTDRGRDLPPGCEEIDDAERDRRESNALSVMQDRFAERHPDEQETHPTLDE